MLMGSRRGVCGDLGIERIYQTDGWIRYLFHQDFKYDHTGKALSSIFGNYGGLTFFYIRGIKARLYSYICIDNLGGSDDK
jgi:hypothetical protein